MPPRFTLFGPAHLATLALTVLVTAVLVLRCRRGHGCPTRALGAVLLTLALTDIVIEGGWGAGWLDVLPLQLCDVALLLACIALLTRRQLAYELTYFWGLAGSLLAMVTPELAAAFPHPRFLAFFALHAGVVVTAVVLTWGVGMRPGRRAVLRVLGWTNLYALFIGAVNQLLGTNYLYLCRKPSTPTLLDAFGPWPWYLLVGEVVALVLFLLLAQLARVAPVRGARGSATAPRA
ncbi:TIGR02206 family membrane protein [Aggregicoccus sp. 17bor-14]|uniref:YwaF family protein n=1 Tax=Myxococcaceae TaxID=31 RepID=UPI00129CCF24|nr:MULTISPECIES: TIGR02206 family membrane protein [Myxococcaceae]MBF5046647.1 TIGR02206 family membrane protein [Simulacricoccus sp. 17bor-14]MRI92356.1 TIGR02206 family membrane protein [Aggregicoccus sp. 17bor-14]